MDASSRESGRRFGRRTVLAGLATGGLVTTSGCVRRARSIVGRDDPDPLSVTITTVPDDVDRSSVMIADILKDTLEAVGIGVSIDYRAIEEFPREVLINHGFDLSVGRHPGCFDPDYLYEALHSRFVDESGYQNPYGYTNLAFDDLLERQRRVDGDERRDAVADVLRAFVVEQPFVPLCVPEEHRLVRTDRFDGWDDRNLATRVGYLGLDSLESADDGGGDLRAITTDPRVTKNLNPLSAEYRNRGLYVDLLYDSLAIEDDGELHPWLAESWEWDDGGDRGNDTGEGSADGDDETDDADAGDTNDANGEGDTNDDTDVRQTATVTLRADLEFHDGEALTADDVAFTYRLLEDTTLGAGSVRSPAPRYRGQTTAIDSIEVIDDRTLEVAVGTGRAVAERAFTVPILPQHIWEPRAGPAQLTGVSVSQGTTEAVVTDNVPAIGSGPFAFVDRTEREFLDLERFDEHFSLREDDLPEPTVETLSTNIEPRSPSAIEAIEGDSADVTVTPLEAYTIENVTETDEVHLHTQSSQTHYQVGFNARRAPFGNPNFRRVVARLLDKAHLVESVFEGHAEAVATPLAGEWVPDELEWAGEDPVVPFLGSDGNLDVDAAREAFEEIGYRYDESGSLLVRR